VLVPDSISLLAPVLVKLPPPEMPPEKVELLVSFTVRAPLPMATEPAPDSVPMTWSRPPRSRRAPLATETALWDEKALALLAVSAPSETVVWPV